MFSLAPGSDARSQHSLEALPAFAALKAEGEAFATRHIGPTAADQAEMLRVVGAVSLDDLIDQTLPSSIRAQKPLGLGAGWTETQVLARLRELAGQNQVMTSLIGQGYYGTVLPAVIQRNILENPAWYTAYTPYQPEISQGRLEALLNFQTMITELTGLDIANSSLLDEATAAAEAMALARRVATSKSNVFFVDAECLPQTIAVLKTRAEPMGITLQLGRPETDLDAQNVFGAIFQYPGTSGQITNPQKQIESLHAAGAIAVMAADPLALTLLAAPGELGADIAIGSTSALVFPWGMVGRMPLIWLCEMPINAACRGAWSVFQSIVLGVRRIVLPCKPVNSIFGAKRPRPTFAPRRCCWLLLQVCMLSIMGQKV